MSTTVSIIIPSLNSPLIDSVIEHILRCEESDRISEILVVGKDEQGLIPQFPLVRLVDTGAAVPPPVARNIGIKESRGDILLFLDSDCLPGPDWLKGHLNAQEDGRPVVGGSVSPEGGNYWHLTYNLTLFHEFLDSSKAGDRNYLPTLNLSVARKVIEEVGALDESLHRGQDIEWTARMRKASFQTTFVPAAAVRHLHNRANLRSVWRDCARSGYYMRQVRLRHQDALSAPRLLRSRRLVLLLAPAIAGWATSRIVLRHPGTMLRFWHTLPAIYVTKIAWCWGASRSTPPPG